MGIANPNAAWKFFSHWLTRCSLLGEHSAGRHHELESVAAPRKQIDTSSLPHPYQGVNERNSTAHSKGHSNPRIKAWADAGHWPNCTKQATLPPSWTFPFTARSASLGCWDLLSVLPAAWQYPIKIPLCSVIVNSLATHAPVSAFPFAQHKLLLFNSQDT